MSDVPLLEENNEELESLEYEVKHNSCKIIGEERFKRINQIIGFLKSNKMFCDALRKFQDFLEKEKKLLKDANLQYNSNFDYTPEMYILMGIIGKFNEVFGVLETQESSNNVEVEDVQGLGREHELTTKGKTQSALISDTNAGSNPAERIAKLEAKITKWKQI